MPELKNIVKAYGEVKVFDGLNLSFETDKITAVMGASGVGKTTLLNILSGMTDFSGEITDKSEKISYIFQSARLIENLSVIKNVEYVLANDYPDKQKRKAVAQEFLSYCEISALAKKKPSELSGGESQRVQLARAFSYPSKLLLMDEPFSSLDISLKMRLIALFKDLLKKSPRTVVFVTHSIDEAIMLSDKVYVLKKGQNKAEEIVVENNEKDESDEKSLTSNASNEARKKILKLLTD